MVLGGVSATRLPEDRLVKEFMRHRKAYLVPFWGSARLTWGSVWGLRRRAPFIGGMGGYNALHRRSHRDESGAVDNLHIPEHVVAENCVMLPIPNNARRPD